MPVSERQRRNPGENTHSRTPSMQSQHSHTSHFSANGTHLPHQPPLLTPGWWFWNTNSHVEQITPTVSQDAVEPTLTWPGLFNSYKNTVVGYVYYNETTPLLESTQLAPSQSRDTKSPSQASNQASSLWLAWFWSQPPEENYEEDTNNVELYKSAKVAIESAQNHSCYAYKGAVSSQFFSDENELAVANSLTERQPVRYNIKRTPVTPAEVQETTLQVVFTEPLKSLSSSIQSKDKDSKDKDQDPKDPKDPKDATALPELNFQTNRLVPTLKNNLRPITWRTSLRLVGEKILFQHSTSECHLYRQIQPPRISKVVVLGVHSFLPTKFVKQMIGQPTGNALGLVEHAAKSVEAWLANKLQMYSIETIALEGQGPVKERVELCLKLLENWIDLIIDCDFLFVAGHSYGSIVAIELVAKLISDPRFRVSAKKVGVLAMSAPINGAFRNLDTRIVTRAFTAVENQVLQELVQLQDSSSEVSRSIYASLDLLVTSNVKVTLSASLDDQLVPIDSALAGLYYHPNLFRCIHVSNRCQHPEFIIQLWQLILVARNVGHLEHGISKDLSEYCLGRPGDGGHAQILTDPQVYDTAVSFAVDTTKVRQQRPLNIVYSEYDSLQSPYKLPWTVRELLQDIISTKHINGTELVQEMVQSYREWEALKVWKPVYQALEAMAETDFDDLMI